MILNDIFSWNHFLFVWGATYFIYFIAKESPWLVPWSWKIIFEILTWSIYRRGVNDENQNLLEDEPKKYLVHFNSIMLYTLFLAYLLFIIFHGALLLLCDKINLYRGWWLRDLLSFSLKTFNYYYYKISLSRCNWSK